eukprot:66486-Rhodomonas_salina.1
MSTGIPRRVDARTRIAKFQAQHDGCGSTWRSAMTDGTKGASGAGVRRLSGSSTKFICVRHARLILSLCAWRATLIRDMPTIL